MSETYVNNKLPIIVGCRYCDQQYQTTYDRFQKGHTHICPEGTTRPSQKRLISYVTKKCLSCRREFTNPKTKRRKCCSAECAKQFRQSLAESGLFKNNGRIGGKISASIEVRRSKNEILFAEMCEKHFDILTNEPMFDGWDADVIIPSLRIAIAWNGVWHYKKVRENHDLEQVQRRDKIKQKIIQQKFGYTFYTIVDMGGASKKLVEQEFRKFMDFLYFV